LKRRRSASIDSGRARPRRTGAVLLGLILLIVGRWGVEAGAGQTAAVAIRGDEVIDRMLAVVAGDLIMLSDVTAAVEFGLVPRASGPDVTRSVLTQLIDRSLMLAEVDRYAPPEPGAAAVDRELQTVRGRFATADAFRAALIRYGLEETHLRETVRANLRLRAYLEQRFTVAGPSDEEIAAYYRDHQDVFRRGGLVPSLDEAREDVVQTMAFARRQTMVDEWIAGLRRRATILDVYGGPRGEDHGGAAGR
jgi:hypothetical protein